MVVFRILSALGLWFDLDRDGADWPRPVHSLSENKPSSVPDKPDNLVYDKNRTRTPRIRTEDLGEDGQIAGLSWEKWTQGKSDRSADLSSLDKSWIDSGAVQPGLKEWKYEVLKPLWAMGLSAAEATNDPAIASQEKGFSLRTVEHYFAVFHKAAAGEAPPPPGKKGGSPRKQPQLFKNL